LNYPSPAIFSSPTFPLQAQQKLLAMENHNQYDDLSPEVQVAIKNHELFPTIPSHFIKDECKLWDEKAPDPRQDLQAANTRYKGNEPLDPSSSSS
jgi:hypothetical protein